MVCLPGDLVRALPEAGEMRLGPGLETHEQHVAATKAGVVHQSKTGTMWLQGRQKRCACVQSIDEEKCTCASHFTY